MTTSSGGQGSAPGTHGGPRPGAFRRREGGPGGGGTGGGGRRYVPRRKVCHFCAEKNATIDYKNADMLRRYVSDRGRIEPRRKTGTCARHQRVLSRNLKWARHIGLLPFTTDTPREGPIPR